MRILKTFVSLYQQLSEILKLNIMNSAFNQIKNTAENRHTDVLKQDIIVAYKNMIAKNNDLTKTVYYALFEVLMSRVSETELDEFESTYKN